MNCIALRAYSFKEYIGILAIMLHANWKSNWPLHCLLAASHFTSFAELLSYDTIAIPVNDCYSFLLISQSAQITLFQHCVVPNLNRLLSLIYGEMKKNCIALFSNSIVFKCDVSFFEKACRLND